MGLNRKRIVAMEHAKEELTAVVLPKHAPYVSLEKLAKINTKVVVRHIKILGEREKRNMKLIKVYLGGNEFKAYADCVTGSLYHAVTGVCLSSTHLHLTPGR